MSVHFSNLYGIFKNSSYHVSKEKTSAQRQKRKKPLLGRPIFTLNLYSLVAVLRNQGRCFLSVILTTPATALLFRRMAVIYISTMSL